MNYTECTICGCMPKPDEWSGQIQGFVLIVDSVWFTPVMGLICLAIIYWYT